MYANFKTLRRQKKIHVTTSTIAISFTKSGRFSILKQLINKLELKTGDGLMFAGSKQKQHIIVFKEPPDVDNYVCRDIKGSSYLRFSAKDLSEYIINILGLDDESKYMLVIDGEVDEKGCLKLKAI